MKTLLYPPDTEGREIEIINGFYQTNCMTEAIQNKVREQNQTSM